MRGQLLVGAAKDVLFDGRVLDDRLDHQVGLDELADRRDPCEGLVRIDAELRQAAPHGLEGMLDSTRRGIEQRDAPARRSYDLRDPAAHLTCADNEYVLELEAHGKRLKRSASRR